MNPDAPNAAGLAPRRIVCLTEETTEWLYLLGQQHRIVGISGYTVRPRQARQEKPRVSAFLTAKIDRILALEPDCVFGFSDLQADIASALIRQGVQVTVFNQRSIEEIFSMLYQVAAIVGEPARGLQHIAAMRAQLDTIRVAAQALPRRPRIFFEEWDTPHISAIRWVSELLTVAVVPEARRKGVGAALVTSAGVAALVRGAFSMHLEVAETNDGARSLDKKLGYEEAGRRHAYYAGEGGSVDAIVMRRALPRPVV